MPSAVSKERDEPGPGIGGTANEAVAAVDVARLVGVHRLEAGDRVQHHRPQADAHAQVGAPWFCSSGGSRRRSRGSSRQSRRRVVGGLDDVGAEQARRAAEVAGVRCPARRGPRWAPNGAPGRAALCRSSLQPARRDRRHGCCAPSRPRDWFQRRQAGRSSPIGMLTAPSALIIWKVPGQAAVAFQLASAARSRTFHHPGRRVLQPNSVPYGCAAPSIRSRSKAEEARQGWGSPPPTSSLDQRDRLRALSGRVSVAVAADVKAGKARPKLDSMFQAGHGR